MRNTNQENVTVTIYALLFVALVVAWFTHVITCFTTAAWGFLIAGAIFFPVGIVHGVYLWFV